jgi:hypothetical protein
MKFYYKLDNLNRFAFITGQDFDGNLLQLEVTQEQLDQIVKDPILFGVENGVLVSKSRTQKEIDDELLHIKINHRVPELKKMLENTDYKIIKCYEAQLSNEEMPYDLQELLTQRKAWRDEINQIEFENAMLG